LDVLIFFCIVFMLREMSSTSGAGFAFIDKTLADACRDIRD